MNDKTEQVVLVVDKKLYLFNKENGKWIKDIETGCEIGKNGLNSDRHSGDNTTPIGAFSLLYSFGTEDKENVETSMEYRKILPTSYFSDDDTDLTTFNSWVESDSEIDGEHLMDYPKQYHYGMVIGFNMYPKIPGRGSSIFLHCKGDKGYTAGCVAIDESIMIDLLKKVKTGAYIMIVPNKNDIENIE